jgi:hypothetical protein
MITWRMKSFSVRGKHNVLEKRDLLGYGFLFSEKKSYESQTRRRTLGMTQGDDFWLSLQ